MSDSANENSKNNQTDASTSSPANSSENNPSTRLCLNNCGFFGSPAFENYCSVCLKAKVTDGEGSLDKEVIDQICAEGEVTDEDSLQSSKQESCIIVEPIPIRPLDGIRMEFVNRKRSFQYISPISDLQDFKKTKDQVEGAAAEIKSKDRCNTCNKKLKISLAFECKCGGFYCSKHRYSDSHKCEFNHRQAAKIALEKNNPVVKGEKLARM
jgi:hypothetical protein